MTKLENYNNTIFESIKHIDEDGCEYWYARELMIVLEYGQWRNFKKVIDKARLSWELSNNQGSYHFADVSKMVIIGVSEREIEDYKLSRYACYLIVQNADVRKEVIAFGPTYFAVQTRKMELTEEEYSKLSEDEKRLYRRRQTRDEKRLYRRRQTRDGNRVLYKIAKEKGVKNFDRFTNAGYKWLYNGETPNDIAKRKGLRYREDILDNMWSVELGANIFRITQTEALLEKQIESSEDIATNTHYKVGKEVRDTIKRLDGTMPEDLPTPSKSINELEKEEELKGLK